MSTLDEIEAAVAQLPLPDRQELLSRLNRPPAPPVRTPEQERAHRMQWLQRLEEQAKSNVTGRKSPAIMETLDEIRADRC